MIALIEQTVANNPGVPAWEGALARAYCFIDRRTEAAEILARAAAKPFEHVRYDTARTSALALYAEAAAQTGSVEAAGMLSELLEPYADQFVWNGVVGYGHARMYLALLAATLGRHEQADAQFAFACDFHHEHGLRLWEARSELGWAEALADAASANGRASTPPARSSSPVSTATARSSHARPRFSKQIPPSAKPRSTPSRPSARAFLLNGRRGQAAPMPVWA